MLGLHRAVRPAVTALLTVVVAGTAGAQEEQDQKDVFEPAIVVTVENRHFNDLRVYAVSGARAWRLGTVVGSQAESFEVPRFLRADVEPLRVVAYPIGTASVARSESVLIRPGEEMVYRVEAHLPLSNVMVRPLN